MTTVAGSSPVDFGPAQGPLPEPVSQRDGVALCLSGGGYRAGLFHLGALRRLNETGVLSRVTTISSVSGGSILAAHLAATIGEAWPSEKTAYGSWQEVEDAFRAFCRRNIRRTPLLIGLLPWNWGRPATAVRQLINAYRQHLNSATLAALPERPRFIFCAADLTYGVNWIFSRDRVGSWRAGYMTGADVDLDVATAVGASSCFPPVFNPLPIGIAPERLADGDDRADGRDERIRGLRLTDGGVYDNMGLEPVWKHHRYVLVSEGGSTFDAQGDQGLWWRLNRYVEVMGNQVGALRKRWLIASFLDTDPDRSMDGTYWGIGSHTSNYAREGEPPVQGYPEDLVDGIISEVRTDLDRFSDAEMKVLINHGYIMAEAATKRWTPELRTSATAFSPPYPDYLDPTRVRTELAHSHQRKLPFGRR